MARGFSTTYGTGSTDQITTGLTTNANLRSYACFVYMNGLGGGSLGRVWDKRGAGVDTDRLNAQSSGVINYFRIWSGGSQGIAITVGTGAWAHVGISCDSSAAANLPLAYKDGVATGTGTGTTGTRTDTANAYYIGNRGTDSARVWDGMIAEFAVWDAILTADEFAMLGADGFSPLLVRPQSLVEYVPMVRDHVSHKLTIGTLTGAAVQPHPRSIILPSHRRSFVYSAAAPPATARRNRMTLLKVA